MDGEGFDERAEEGKEVEVLPERGEGAGNALSLEIWLAFEDGLEKEEGIEISADDSDRQEGGVTIEEVDSRMKSEDEEVAGEEARERPSM